MMILAEPLAELFNRSKRLVLHFGSIAPGTDEQENIADYFRTMQAKGLNPRLPENRQAFNERVLDRSGMRYLVSAYGEDRSSMLQGSSIGREGRTMHLGIDIFSKHLEPVLAPCDGSIIRTGREQAAHSFGNFVILQPDSSDLPLLFFGHLSFDMPALGHVTKGQTIGRLGDYIDNENGGWSRHLHLQCLTWLPSENEAPPGYASTVSLRQLQAVYPDPMAYFAGWKPTH